MKYKFGVSFIVVMRNVNFVDLNKTLKSINLYSQGFEFEIILQDGSDKPLTMGLPASVKYFFGKDKGIYNAMNMASKRAMYSHLFYINVGDELQQGIKSLDLNNYSSIQYFNFLRDTEKYITPKRITKFFMLRNALCHQCQVYPRMILENIGFYNEDYKVLADQDLSIKIFFKKYPFTKVNEFVCQTAPMGFSELNSGIKKNERKRIINNYFRQYHFLRFRYFLTFPRLREFLFRIRAIRKIRFSLLKLFYEN